MRHSNITDTFQIDNQLLLDKDISLLNMAKSISKKRSVKASTAKPLGKPPPGDKTCGVDPAIRFYEIEYVDETEKREEVEILVAYGSSLAASKKNLVKRQFPYINTFNREGPVIIYAMHDLTIGVHLDIIYPTDVKKILAYTQRILRRSVLKNT